METKRHRFPTDLQDDLSIYCFRLRNEHRMKLQKIGELINRDHSTVVYHLQRYSTFISFDKQFIQKAQNFNDQEFAQKLLEYGIEPYQNLINNI